MHSKNKNNNNVPRTQVVYFLYFAVKKIMFRVSADAVAYQKTTAKIKT